MAAAGCNHKRAATLGPRHVTWAEAVSFLRHCDAKAVEQTHARLVTLTLRRGPKVYAREPKIDQMFVEINRLPRKCRPAQVATE
jgi:hypothetical protein